MFFLAIARLLFAKMPDRTQVHIVLMFLRRAAISLPLSRRFFSTNNLHDLSTSIAELNKEMESVFGEPPPAGLGGSSSTDMGNSAQDFQSYGLASCVGKNAMAQISHSVSYKLNREAFGLTHIGNSGEAQMVDVSPKDATKRTAIASCKVVLGKKVFDMVLANQMAKGDVLTVAKLAGITGAKQTSSLIPLCHNITLTHVCVNLTLNPDDYSVEIQGEAASTGKTGVEMEAMTAVTVAGLTVYDMCKAASKEIQITDVQLERKTGGKSGDWSRR